MVELKSTNKLKGWIIDLRFNFGGNIHPMLLALYELLGETKVLGTLDINKNQISMVRLEDDKYIGNDTVVSSINLKGKSLRKNPLQL